MEGAFYARVDVDAKLLWLSVNLAVVYLKLQLRGRGWTEGRLAHNSERSPNCSCYRGTISGYNRGKRQQRRAVGAGTKAPVNEIIMIIAEFSRQKKTDTKYVIGRALGPFFMPLCDYRPNLKNFISTFQRLATSRDVLITTAPYPISDTGPVLKCAGPRSSFDVSLGGRRLTIKIFTVITN
ncbi:hypothetical protein EVAR_34325_1 [Eumeta japonica]|uniref:Uncharacterized protein n=1 Tax=Eumeta variegata TaxID=151549 RepID=A0A4C1VE96_EUMVA|nr:hypothetical protein EVAR_34325_1 [Eumeta japonica]